MSRGSVADTSPIRRARCLGQSTGVLLSDSKPPQSSALASPQRISFMPMPIAVMPEQQARSTVADGVVSVELRQQHRLPHRREHRRRHHPDAAVERVESDRLAGRRVPSPRRSRARPGAARQCPSARPRNGRTASAPRRRRRHRTMDRTWGPCDSATGRCCSGAASSGPPVRGDHCHRSNAAAILPRGAVRCTPACPYRGPPVRLKKVRSMPSLAGS